MPWNNSLGEKSIDRASYGALGRQGRVRLDSDRLWRFVTAMEKSWAQSFFSLFSNLSLLVEFRIDSTILKKNSLLKIAMGSFKSTFYFQYLVIFYYLVTP